MAEANKDEQIGFHKGSLTTLAKERQELLKMVSIVEQLMQMHIKGLKDLGVDLEAEAKKAQDKSSSEHSATKLADKKAKKVSLEDDLL